MTKVYKYIDVNFADQAATGRFRLRPFEQYAALENPNVRDLYDGVGIGHIRHDGSSALAPEVQERMRRGGIDFGKAVGSFIDVKIIYRSPPWRFCLCFTTEFPNPKFENDVDYGAVIEIDSGEDLAIEITNAHSELGGGCFSRKVDYVEREVDLKMQSASVNPFQKGPNFSDEREWRIIWDTKLPRDTLFFDTNARRAKRLMRRIR